MRLRWLPAAARDIEEIRDYLREHFPSLTHRTMNEIYDGILALRQTPWRGRPGHESGTRELVFPRLPYIVSYRIKNEAIEVLYIRHGAQDRP